MIKGAKKSLDAPTVTGDHDRMQRYLSFYLQEISGEIAIIAYARDIALVRSAFRRTQIPVREYPLGRGYGNRFVMRRSDVPKQWIRRTSKGEEIVVPVHTPKRKGELRIPSGDIEGKGCTLEKGETNDCTVHALAAVLGVAYEVAHKICEDSGRHHGKGHSSFRIIEEIRLRHGVKVEKVAKERCLTLKTFISSHTSGHYFITIRHHAIALIDGRVISSQSSEPAYAKLHQAWRVERSA